MTTYDLCRAHAQPVFPWAFVVVFTDSFHSRGRGCATFTPLLSGLHLPLVKTLGAHGGASIHFEHSVLAALMCHCWLRFSVNEEGAPSTNMTPFLTTTCVHSLPPRALTPLDLVRSQAVLMGVVEIIYIVSLCAWAVATDYHYKCHFEVL